MVSSVGSSEVLYFVVYPVPTTVTKVCFSRSIFFQNSNNNVSNTLTK